VSLYANTSLLPKNGLDGQKSPLTVTTEHQNYRPKTLAKKSDERMIFRVMTIVKEGDNNLYHLMKCSSLKHVKAAQEKFDSMDIVVPLHKHGRDYVVVVSGRSHEVILRAIGIPDHVPSLTTTTGCTMTHYIVPQTYIDRSKLNTLKKMR
jgi:hypothetical protein